MPYFARKGIGLRFYYCEKGSACSFMALQNDLGTDVRALFLLPESQTLILKCQVLQSWDRVGDFSVSPGSMRNIRSCEKLYK